MLYMNVAVVFVAGMMLFEPFTRAPASRFTTPRMRRSLAARSYYQAGAAFFAALLIVTSPPAPERTSPLFVMCVAAILTFAGIYWVVRGRRFLSAAFSTTCTDFPRGAFLAVSRPADRLRIPGVSNRAEKHFAPTGTYALPVYSGQSTRQRTDEKKGATFP